MESLGRCLSHVFSIAGISKKIKTPEDSLETVHCVLQCSQKTIKVF